MRNRKGGVRRPSTHDDPESTFLPPYDARLKDLVMAMYRGRINHWQTTVPLADLGVHHPPTLARTQTALRADPKLRGATLKVLLDKQPALVAFRDETGRLVMFDDYLFYAVALDAGLTQVTVCIMDEAEPIH